MEKTLKAFLEESIASRERQVQVSKDLGNPRSQAQFEGELRALKIVLESLPEFTHPSQPSEQKPSEKDVSKGAEDILDRLMKDGLWYEIGGRKLFQKEDVLKAMQEFSQAQRLQARNEAIQECIDLSIRLAGIDYWQDEAAKDVIGKLIERLENLKKNKL